MSGVWTGQGSPAREVRFTEQHIDTQHGLYSKVSYGYPMRPSFCLIANAIGAKFESGWWTVTATHSAIDVFIMSSFAVDVLETRARAQTGKDIHTVPTHFYMTASMFEEEDEEIWESPYENGHWEWDLAEEELKFVSDLPPSQEEFELSTTHIANIEFKNDIDLWEQQKFKKRLQRKPAENDIVMLQDVKDVVLFTAPSSILSPAVINMLHLPTTERFLRALILCCQYYLQITEVMSLRTIELETKIPTENSKKLELKYQQDLEDLRLLIAKEYCIIVLGGEEYMKYHHMGKSKQRSLSKKDAILFETIIRISIQIVWIALGRKHYNQIEMEINRILKSDIYNPAAHKRDKTYLPKTNPRERSVLTGHCMRAGKKVNTHSPLVNEVFCDRNIGFRLYGLGALKYSGLSARLRYLESILSEPEHKFGKLGVTLGIIGLPRAEFDTMLRELRMDANTSTSSSSMRLSRISRVSRVMSRTSRKSTVAAVPKKLYPDIHIPEKGQTPESLPDHFPGEMLPKLSSNNEQRLKWIRRISSKRKRTRR